MVSKLMGYCLSLSQCVERDRTTLNEGFASGIKIAEDPILHDEVSMTTATAWNRRDWGNYGTSSQIRVEKRSGK